MLLKALSMRMATLTQDIDALYEVAQDGGHCTGARLAAAGTLTSFLSSPSQRPERWFLDMLVMRLGLCMVYALVGRTDYELQKDVSLVREELSPRAVRRLEALLERLSSNEFAGGGMASVIADAVALDRLYQQALTKAATMPAQLSDARVDTSELEALLV